MYDSERRRAPERGIPDSLLIGLLGFLLALTVLTWLATGLAALFTHGAWPDGVTFTRTPLALRHLMGAPHNIPGAWPDAPADQLSGYGLFWGLLIGELMVLVVLTIFVLGVLARLKVQRAVTRERAMAGAGAVAGPPTAVENTRADTKVIAGVDAGVDDKAQSRPEPGATTPTDQTTPAIPPVPSVQMAPTTATVPTAPAAPTTPAVPTPRIPRVLYGSPETRRPSAVQAVLDAEGAALVVTSDPTVWAETKDARAKLGPVLVYDPGHLCDTPARLHWSPTTGCEHPDVAAARAVALLAPVRPQARLDAAMADTAETLLSSWLHAAAVDGRPFRQVHRWAQGSSAHEAVRILRTHPKASSGAAGLLESALTAYPERREVAQELTVRALAALSSIHIREACTPNRTDSLTLESFIDEGGTLYVVGEAIEDPKSRPGAMPLLTALASSVVEHGRRMAARSTDGRLDPPMTFVLDDVAAVAPLPLLPELLSTGQDQGLSALVLLRSQEQGRARWPDHTLTTG
ncbi:type VI secretion protein [Streptomyces sp. ISL-98]|uniref:type VI secretion protein n=1 Tax=Streptomyces sp. ISL-98 TaxID=2819192 RepID=UPI001BE83BAE|nr:type VI secretion protein [Streptomyces sp. ISL-98]MBT2510838.1 type VI secretion protein [Streptomyces sp. ISL-98]